MVRYTVPVWKLIYEVVDTLEPPFTTRDILEAVHSARPDLEIKDKTIRSIIIGCSVNHSSRHYYSMPKRFLFQVGRGKYKVYDPEADGKVFDDVRKASEGKGGKVLYERIDEKNKVTLPLELRQAAGIGVGDFVGFEVTEDGEVVIKKAKPKFEL